MRTLSTLQVRKALLLAGCAGAFAVSSPVFAQEAPPVGAPEETPAADAAAVTDGTPIVVTGSRIARQDYNTNSPMVTVSDALLKESSTSALEQNLNKLPQFTPAQTPTGGADIQPTATNTPGAATVSLRGLGANRNLILLDGRRATPGNASGVVDINTIPAAAIERVEVITGGASATYGADAIAGVTNFILKKNFSGLELDGRMGITQEGDGFEYELSGIVGADFDEGRGNVSLAMSINSRESSEQRDRSWYRDLWTDPQVAGDQFFIEYPGVVFNGDTGFPSNAAVSQLFPGANQTFIGQGPNDITQLFGYTIYTQPQANNAPFTGFGFFGNFLQGGTKNFQGFTTDPLRYHRTADGGQAANYANYYLVLPLERQNLFARGNYEINDWIGVFGQGLFSHVSTKNKNQGGAITGGWDVYVPYGTGVYTGSQLGLPVPVGGATINAAGFGNNSSVLLNGQPFSGGVYNDPTPTVLSDNPTNPAFASQYGNTFACAKQAVGGCTNNQLFGQYLPAALQTALNSRSRPAFPGEAGYNADPALNGTVSLANNPVQLNYGIPEPRTVFTDVDTYNLTAGFQGSIPTTDWTWEAFANFGQSITFARQTGTFSLARTRALLQAPGFGLNFNNNSNTASNRSAFGSNAATCTSGLNIFALSWDQVSEDCKDAIRSDLKNRSKLTQKIFEVNAQGSLFTLPAGDLRAAIGASYRSTNYEFLNDSLTTQGSSFLDQAIGIYPSADSRGKITAREVYGELLVPILKDTFVQELNLELGGRISNYNTTGTSYTYKILGDLAVVDWLRFRGGYNRAERTPNIAELFLSPQQTFAVNTIGDICSQASNYFISANASAPGNTSARAADIKATCSAIMDNTGGAGSGTAYYSRPLAQQPQPGVGFAFPTLYGNPNLTPEVADTWTAGVVLSSPIRSGFLQRLRLSVDWYNIKLSNAISWSPAATLQQCLDPFYNPAVNGAAGSAAAAQAAARATQCAGTTTTVRYDPAPVLGLGNITAAYTNDGRVDISGIDAQLDWSAPVGPGTLSLNVVGSYFLHYKVAELSNNPLVDYAGTFGTSVAGLNPGAYRYRVLTTVGYGIGPARLSLQWQHLPAVEDSGEAQQITPTYGAPSYDLFNLSGSYELTDDIRFRFGVDNLLNTAPPLTNYNPSADNALGQLRGGSYNSQFYDTIGRRFYVGANIQF